MSNNRQSTSELERPPTRPRSSPAPSNVTSSPRGGSTGLTYVRIVDQVTRSGMSQRELGDAVGTSLRTVQNWAAGSSTPRGGSREKLLDVQYLLDELRDVYTDEGVDIWLRARNRNLDGSRPVDLITSGQIETVLAEAQRLASAM